MSPLRGEGGGSEMGGMSNLHKWWSKDRREQLAACPVITLVKKCSRCKKAKDRDEFYKNARIASGLSSACIECTRKMNLKYYHDNKEK